jgi:hypothetical protein
MKKLALVLGLLLAATGSAFAQGAAPAQDYALPQLHVIKTATLSPSYSCRPEEEFQKGYENTALYLSDYSKRSSGPDLLFNGACRADDEFQSSTAGDDMAFVVDLGPDLQLEQLTASGILQLYHRLSSPAPSNSKQAQSALRDSVKVVAGHTYAVLLNKSRVRGLFAFTVMTHVPNQRVELRYVVKEYQALAVMAQSPSFDWDQMNSAAPDPKPVMEKTRGGREN